MRDRVREALLAWYAAQGRDLPWRRTSDPYHILVAEVMLQQTQVERVVPKYLEFLEAFPTVRDLAEAPRAEVIRRWAPLGYNLRAVRLHRIAQEVVERWGGRFPDSDEELLRLPGVGPYTAGAILCFAYRQPSVFLDTNLRRVLGRCFGGMPYPSPADDRRILVLAREALPAEAAYPWHQALMDLGATVCVRRRPACGRCPVALWCLARPILAAGDGERPAQAAAEPVAPYRVQSGFAGSRRYLRGRAVAALRELGPGERLTLKTLKERLTAAGTIALDEEYLRELVRDLERDGLASVSASGGAPEVWLVGLP